MYQHNTVEFCIRKIHSINFTCPENVSSFRIKVKIFSTNCLSKSSMPGRASSCVEQDGASSTLVGTTVFKGTGSMGIKAPEVAEIPSCGSVYSLDLMVFSLDKRTTFLTLERWLVKNSRTYESPQVVSNNLKTFLQSTKKI